MQLFVTGRCVRAKKRKEKRNAAETAADYEILGIINGLSAIRGALAPWPFLT